MALGQRAEASPPGLRILVVQPTGDKMGHYGIFTTKLSHALARRGHAVTVCTNRLTPERYLDTPPAFQVELAAGGGLPFAPFDAAASRSKLYYLWGYYRNSLRVTAAALRLCRARPFDLIYIIDAEFLIASLLLKTARGLPPVVMEVNAANFSFADYPGSLLKKAYKVLQREIFRMTLGRQIAACAVLGEWHEKQLRRQLRVSDRFPIEAIPEGADSPVPPPPKAEARRRLGIVFDGPALLFFGMLRKDKGLESLLRAVARLPGGDFRLVVAGHPMDYRVEEIQALIDRLGVEDRVVLRLGYVDPADVAAYFGAVDGLVLPYASSYRGGIGPLTKGACAYGRPVIGTDVSGMGDFITRYGIGLVCPPDDDPALAEQLRAFLALPAPDRDAMGRRAEAFGRANSWEAMGRRFSALFERVAGARAAAGLRWSGG